MLIAPFSTQQVEESRNHAYRAALSYWAKAGGYNNDEIQQWFTNVLNQYATLDHIPYNSGVWEGFFATYPIELPRDVEGKVDAQHKFWAEFGGYWQRALITAQAAEVMHECALGGGDDTWFDYLPNGIKLLEALQSEEWAEMIKDYVDTMSEFDRNSADDDDPRMDAEEAMADRWGFFVQDTTSPLVAWYL